MLYLGTEVITAGDAHETYYNIVNIYIYIRH